MEAGDVFAFFCTAAASFRISFESETLKFVTGVGLTRITGDDDDAGAARVGAPDAVVAAGAASLEDAAGAPSMLY